MYKPKPHPIYYLEDGNLSFIAKGFLYRVHRYFFLRESANFRRILQPPYNKCPGFTDENPIPLPKEVTAEQLDAVLWMFYNPTYTHHSRAAEDWLSTLHLAHRWGMHQVLAAAQYALSSVDMLSVERVTLCRRYDIPYSWAQKELIKMCIRHDALSLDDWRYLGTDVAVRIAEARQAKKNHDTHQKLAPRNTRQQSPWRTTEGAGKVVDELIVEPLMKEQKSQRVTSTLVVTEKEKEKVEPTRHPKYYFPDGNLILKVEDALFRVHRFFLERDSAVFRDLALVPPEPGSEPEGLTDARPIALDLITVADFEALLWFVYNPTYVEYDAPMATWLSILHLSDLWDIVPIRKAAIDAALKITGHSVEKIYIAHRYGVDLQRVFGSYMDLIQREGAVTKDEGRMLDIDVGCKVIQLRELFLDKRGEVAEEEWMMKLDSPAV